VSRPNVSSRTIRSACFKRGWHVTDAGRVARRSAERHGRLRVHLPYSMVARVDVSNDVAHTARHGHRRACRYLAVTATAWGKRVARLREPVPFDACDRNLKVIRVEVTAR